METGTRLAAAVLCCLLGLTGCAPGGSPGSTPDRTPPSPARSAAPDSPAPDGARPGRSAPAREDPLDGALEGDPAAPRSPRQVASQLVAADRAIHDPATSPKRLTAAGHTQSLATRVLARRPQWDRRVAQLLPPVVRRDTAADVAANRAFRSMHPSRRRDLATELPAWRIVSPPPARELKRYYLEAERRSGVDWEYLAAIHLVETRFGRIEGTSVAGAQGPMQFIPSTWDVYGAGGDIEDPHDAILAAGRLLSANGFARDRAAALHRYNDSSAYVRGVLLHARVMERRPRSFLGYHQWPVSYLTRWGTVLLPEGYAERRPVPVREYLRRR